jgi:CelD/BcsL family acetyltransferase involved in cellulose biosynthesis
MNIRTVRSLREFDDLAKTWQEVLEAGDQSSVLLTHDWFACCWRTAGPDRERELWIVEDAAGPLALIPLVRARTRYRGLPARVLQLMHAPEWPTVEVPVARDVDEVMRVVLEQLDARDDWDMFLMPGLPAHSPIWKAFESAAGPRFPRRIAHRISIPFVALSARNPSLQTALEARRRAARPTLAHLGDNVVVEEHRQLDPRGPLFEEIMGVVRAGIRGPAILPAPSAEQVHRFFRELTARAIRKGWLSLWVLRVDGRVVETEYQLSAHGVVNALRRDGDPNPAGLRFGDALGLKILETLAVRPTARTYVSTPMRHDEPRLAGFDAQETLFVEVFADRSYQHLVHRIESRVASFARRLAGQ